MRTAFRVLLIGWLLLAVGWPAHARMIIPRDEMENPGIAVQQPDHILTFPKKDPALDIDFSTDGSRLIFTQDSEVLDVWRVAVWVWPETVLSILGLCVLCLLAKTVRRRRRFPTGRGPYCAHCAYETRGLQSDTCPECGKALAGKGTIQGVTRGRTFAVAIVLLCVTASIGATYKLTNPPRHGSASHWFAWRFEGLASWARAAKVEWMERLIQDSTAVRVVPADDSSDIHTIVNVPRVRNPFSLIERIESFDVLMGGYPRPYPDDVIHTNAEQTIAVVNNKAYAYRIDLTTFAYKEVPHQIDRPAAIGWNYWVLNADGNEEYRFERHWPDEANPDQPHYTLTHSERGELAYTARPEVVLPIQFRSGSFSRQLDLLFDDDPTPEALVEEPYQPATIHIQPYTAEDGYVFYRCKEKECHLTSYVSCGYLVVLSDGMIYLYDLGTAVWVVALDPTPVHGLGSMDGTATALSADRRWFAVRGHDGEKVAVYRLPEPAGGP